MEKSDGATLIQTSSGELCVSVVLVSEAVIMSNGRLWLMRNSLPGSVAHLMREDFHLELISHQHGVRRGFGKEISTTQLLNFSQKGTGFKPMELFAIDGRSGTIERQQFVDMMASFVKIM